MSELLFGLYFRFCFKENPQVFVLNKRVLWPQSRSVLGQFFFPGSVERVYNQRLNFANFVLPLILFTICFVAPKQKLFYGNFW